MPAQIAAPRPNRKLTQDELKKMRERDSKLVKGRFRFHEVPGGSVTFSYKKYAEEPVGKYTFVDGEVYEIPLGVAKHLNQRCFYNKHTHVLDANGDPVVDQGKKVQRMSFESLEFSGMDDE